MFRLLTEYQLAITQHLERSEVLLQNQLINCWQVATRTILGSLCCLGG
jgi:hypothetical protein